MRTARGSSRPWVWGGEGVCLSACWDTQPPLGVGLETSPPLQLWAWRPPAVGLETPLARPLNFPPGCGIGDTPGDLQGMLGYHLPPWTE